MRLLSRIGFSEFTVKGVSSVGRDGRRSLEIEAFEDEEILEIVGDEGVWKSKCSEIMAFEDEGVLEIWREIRRKEIKRISYLFSNRTFSKRC